MRSRSRTVKVALAALIAGVLIAVPAVAQNDTIKVFRDTLAELLRGNDGKSVAETGSKASTRVPLGRGDIQLSFAPLVRETAPAVVNVYAARQVNATSPFAGDPFFERFFGRQMPPRIQSSLGSGVMVDSEGIVVTNYHVIRGADEVRVALPDGREYESEILLKDERVDIAVLKVDADERFQSIEFGDSEALEIGDLVLAIGNPFGVGQTTTSGIVSALARNGIGISDFGFFIQTDAAINPGNSGGALINMSGRLIGINTAIYSGSGGSIGIGFAVPSNMVRAVVDAALKGEEFFERPFLGAAFEPMSAAAAESLGLSRPHGALVTSIYQGGPAEAAGLRPGDAVLALNGDRIEHPDALGYRLDTKTEGSQGAAVRASGQQGRIGNHDRW
jgi:Do/DeqQ family serine protease